LGKKEKIPVGTISADKSPIIIVDHSKLFQGKNGVELGPLERAKKIFTFLKFIGKID